MCNILPISPAGPTLTKLFLALKNYLVKCGRERVLPAPKVGQPIVIYGVAKSSPSYVHQLAES